MAARGATIRPLRLLRWLLLSCVSAVACTALTRVSSARAALRAYDEGHRHAARDGGEGMGGAISANAWSRSADRAALIDAVRTVSAHAQRVMLGLCADDADSAVSGLKCWVGALGLPRGTLHGMDEGGVPRDMSAFGPCYVKYNSLQTGSGDPAGSAHLSGYGGDFRGVYLSVDLGDDAFEQYGVLPLDLFPPSPSSPCGGAGGGAGGARAGASAGGAAVLSFDGVAQLVEQLQPDVQRAGGSLRLLAVSSADGSVTVELRGPAVRKRVVFI
ncbi:hypothetical protein KFE25_011049 [Diacronema lutheri]|uniref:Uncharacterized protein n=1 Tax=Diacronema lutheri TaxID=2081491 RepID=A0A8J5XJW7_DIALT|nr:hypothetical protein KFE25_011049 [Diacronema lutheri]